MSDKKKQTRLEKHIKSEVSSKYSIKRDIEFSPLRLKSKPDEAARAYITEHCGKVSHSNIVPGMMIMFQYYEPKTKEDIEYYDAFPCTIFFGVVNTKQGKRILGFNIHYYPPAIRRKIVVRIFEIFKPIYIKYFTKGITHEIDAFDYEYIMESLEKAKLNFGVRMYIPDLIGHTYDIKPNQWNVAVYTEGWFKKETRAAIMKYWKEFKSSK